MANESVAQSNAAAPVLLADTRTRMVKAEVRNADANHFRVCIGKAIDRARLLRGWSLKELAAAIDRDERQVARWITGEQRPQFDALIAVPSFRRPLFLAWCEVFGEGVEIETVVKVRSA